jgi:hypothetical protein
VTLPCNIKIYYNLQYISNCTLLPDRLYIFNRTYFQSRHIFNFTHGHKHNFNQNTAKKPCLNTKLRQVTIPNTVVEIYMETLLKNPVLACKQSQVNRQRCINFSVPSQSEPHHIVNLCPNLAHERLQNFLSWQFSILMSTSSAYKFLKRSYMSLFGPYCRGKLFPTHVWKDKMKEFDVMSDFVSM